ncbi:MAG: putative DNA modification/repair radical SAM protein [Spirochaetes bacterium]|nr:putative DNA modification/repair radical SAM protein [Spirochaetota bacterium]
MIVELEEKISILAEAAKYDASCASSGTRGKHHAARKGGMGSSVAMGVCHSWTGDGRCVTLLKLLFSNVCKYDCVFCANRASADIRRASFTKDELVKLTIEFYRRNYIEGLFLLSGIFADPDIVMEQLVGTAKKLRLEAGFGGYIHLKVIPGAGERLLWEAGYWADRLSANIELPTEKSLRILAPEKSGKEIFGAMSYISQSGLEIKEDGLSRTIKKAPKFAPAGQSTQLVVGASNEDDRQIIALSGALYRKYALKRVYYSAFIPVGLNGDLAMRDPLLPDIEGPPLVREHRLYQADWLMRFYNFSPDEILDPVSPFLDKDLDPKTVWALRHLDFFPVEVNKASYEELLRVPGIGAVSAQRIIGQRRSSLLTFDILKSLGVVLKRARYFITASGSFIDKPDDPERIRVKLIHGEQGSAGSQLAFDF